MIYLWQDVFLMDAAPLPLFRPVITLKSPAITSKVMLCAINVMNACR